MSFSKLPDGMIHYATYELAEKLTKLSVQQRRAVDVIVRRHVIGGEHLAMLFRGDDKICTDTNYYKRGYVDADTGELRKAGWSHQPDFVDALNEATRLALQTEQRENMRKLQKATQRAIDNAATAVDMWLEVSKDKSQHGQARNDAGGRIVDLAFRSQATESDAAGSAAADWWAANE